MTTGKSVSGQPEFSLRDVGRYDADDKRWEQVKFADLRAGDVFQMQEGGGGEDVGTFVAISNPYHTEQGVGIIDVQDATELSRVLDEAAGREPQAGPTEAEQRYRDLLVRVGVCPDCEELIRREDEDAICWCGCVGGGIWPLSRTVPLIDALLTRYKRTVDYVRGMDADNASALEMKQRIVNNLQSRWVSLRESVASYGVGVKPRYASRKAAKAPMVDVSAAMQATRKTASGWEISCDVVSLEEFRSTHSDEAMEQCSQFAADEMLRDVLRARIGHKGSESYVAFPDGAFTLRSFWGDDGQEVLQR